MAAQTLSERLAAEQAAVIKQTKDVEALREQVSMLNEQVCMPAGRELGGRACGRKLLTREGRGAEFRGGVGGRL